MSNINIENVNKAIAVMERVKARGDVVDMSDWLERSFSARPTEQELHTCGTAACFAGWVAVSPEWEKDGGTASVTGCPEMSWKWGVTAISDWLGLTKLEGGHLCGTERYGVIAHLDVYPEADEHVTNITADDILTALYRLRDTGSVYKGRPRISGGYTP